MNPKNDELFSTDFMTNVYELIEKHNLKRKDRKRATIYKRYYLYNQLYKAQLSLTHIGLLFNKDHATIIHGLKMHKLYSAQNDQIYLHFIQPIIDELKYSPQPRDLKREVLECQTMEDLFIIKQNIERNLY
jgi:hypothetical protein